MSIYNTISSIFIVFFCAHACLAAKLVNENDTKTEEDSSKVKSKRNYDVHRLGVQHGGPHRFGPVRGHGQGYENAPPNFGYQSNPYARGNNGEDGSSEEPHQGIPHPGIGHELGIEYSPHGPPRGIETDYTENNEQIREHEEDIMATQNTMNLYYDDLMRLQSLMSNIVSDPHSEAEGPDFDPDY